MNGEFRVGEWLVQRELNRISKNNKSIQLEPKVMEVLVFLAGKPGEVLSRQDFHEAIWPGTFVGNEVLTYSISELRRAFEDNARNPRIIQTIPRRGYRLIATVSGSEKTETVPEVLPPPASAVPLRRRAGPAYIGGAAALALLSIALLAWFHPWSSALAPNDFILLTDFANSTADPVFDDTLKHAVAMHLTQSPFLNIFPEDRVRETLRYMGRQPDASITREIGREICVRRGIKAMLTGSIASMGRIYVISLEVLNGQTGEVLAREQFEVASKEEVLRGLGLGATSLRKKLGESMKSLEKFDMPLEQATTASLDAFKAYSAGRKHLISGRFVEAIPHYHRALEFDADFASVYDDLAWCYSALAQHDLAAESATKAYSLRSRVSEYERLSIESIYYTMATGEIDKAIETLEVMRTIYPRSAPVHNTLGGRYMSAGEFEKAIESFREAIRLTHHPNAYSGLAGALVRLNRCQEAKEVIGEARDLGIDNRDLRLSLYTIAFIQGNPAGMIEQVRWASGKPDETFMLAQQAGAAAVLGQMTVARKFYGQAIDAARRHDLKNAEAELAADAGRWEAFFGNNAEACNRAESALSTDRGWKVVFRSAMILARCGRSAEAQALIDEVSQKRRLPTAIQNVSLPTLRAFVELSSGNAQQALKLVEIRNSRLSRGNLWPTYVAGEAYLRTRSAAEARKEFQKILDHRGLEPLSPLQPLAKIGLARALAASIDKERGRKAYQDFFASWVNADQDIPLFRLALSEYAGLK